MSTTNTASRKDGIVAALGVVSLLIGTATGNAFVMLVIAVLALIAMAIVFWRRAGIRTLLTLAVAATVSVMVAMYFGKM